MSKDMTAPLCPRKVPRHLASAGRHSLIVRSPLPEARVSSEVLASAQTRSVWPAMRSRHMPSAGSRSRTSLSRPAQLTTPPTPTTRAYTAESDEPLEDTELVVAAVVEATWVDEAPAPVRPRAVAASAYAPSDFVKPSAALLREYRSREERALDENPRSGLSEGDDDRGAATGGGRFDDRGPREGRGDGWPPPVILSRGREGCARGDAGAGPPWP